MSLARQSQSLMFSSFCSVFQTLEGSQKVVVDQSSSDKSFPPKTGGKKSAQKPPTWQGSNTNKTSVPRFSSGSGSGSGSHLFGSLFLFFFVLVQFMESASASDCDPLGETVVVELMKLLKRARDFLDETGNEEKICLLNNVDAFNNLVVGVMVGFSVIALVICLCDLGCLGAVFINRHDSGGCCTSGCAVSCCTCWSLVFAFVAMLLPIPLHAVAWTSFWSSFGECGSVDPSDGFKACWEENAEILDMDKSGMLALPIAFGILAVLAPIVLCVTALLLQPQSTRVVEVGVKDSAALNNQQQGSPA